MTSKSLLMWTVPFVLLAHYIAVFPHELTHSFVAWALGYKPNPFNIQYGGTSLSNLLFLSGVDEKVDYQDIFQQNPYHVALIAFAGPGIANGGLFLLSFWLLQKEHIQLTSRWICPAIIVFCWPDRQWVREKMAAIQEKFSSEQPHRVRPVLSPELHVAPSL